MKLWKLILLALFSLFVVIQLFRPDLSPGEPPLAANALQAHVATPPVIDSILSVSCNDCHTYKTRWPWYAQVAPVSWWLAHHVSEGRSKLDLSNFGAMDSIKQARTIQRMAREVKSGGMPLPSYLIIHTTAKLSDEQKKAFADWADSSIKKLAPNGLPALKQPPGGGPGTEGGPKPDGN